MAGQEGVQALGAEAAGVGVAGVAGQEGERDRAVELAEDPRRAGPEGVELGAQLVGQRDPGADQVFAGADQRAQRQRLVGAGGQRGEAVAVGAAQFAQHERVEAVGFAGGGAEAIARGGELVGMDRQHRDPRGQQPGDQQPVGALDRDPGDPMLDQAPQSTRRSRARRGRNARPTAACRARRRRRRRATASPIDPAHCGHACSSPSEVASQRAGREVPWRVLIDRPSTGRHPVAALGASHRREALVSCGPSTRQANLALSRRWSALYAPQYQGRPSLRSGLFSVSRKETENTPLSALPGRKVAL